MNDQATRDAYVATLEEENARLKRSLEFALNRKQVFADELSEVQRALKAAQDQVRVFKEFQVAVRGMLGGMGQTTLRGESPFKFNGLFLIPKP